MITISLDEQGNFEEECQTPLFIAGLIFDELDEENPEEEIRKERKRIEAYYKKLIEEVKNEKDLIISYPDALHSNGNGQRDHVVVSPVKEKVKETFSEFISSGRYHGEDLCDVDGRSFPERKGKYHLFVILKSTAGKKKLLSRGANILANDDWAANRYFHMASTVVNKIIFHNPLYHPKHMPSIAIDLASRSTGNVDELDENLNDEFKKQGYRVNEGRNGDYRYYSIMNADIYRTLIAQEMVNCGKTNLKIEKFFVKSIQYHHPGMMEFLYLSDSICSILGYKLAGENAEEWLGEIVERVNSLNPQNENLIFGYDEIDNDFTEAWSCYERGDYLNALSLTYDAKLKHGKFAEYYKEQWFPYVEKVVKDTVDPLSFAANVDALSSMLLVNNLDQEKLLYLLLQYEEMASRVSNQYRSKDMKCRTLYKLYDVGLSAFCHIGNAKKAMEYYEKCKKYSFYVGIDEYLNTNIKLCVCLEDAFEWDTALELAKENIEIQKMLNDLKREVLDQNSNQTSLEEAKTISQLARIYSLKRDLKAEEYYRDALAILEPDSANYKITQSYLLHFYADMGMKEKFEEEFWKYFAPYKTYNQVLKYLISTEEADDSIYSYEYALYVWARGLTLFGMDELNEGLWDKILNLNESIIKKTGREASGHPWEIIYKYFQLLAIRQKDTEALAMFDSLKKNSLRQQGAIIEAIELFGQAEVSNEKSEFEERDRITNSLIRFLKEHFESFEMKQFSTDGTMRFQELEIYFSFMYR